MEVVNRWRASNFERRAVEAVLAEAVEWVVPKRGGVITLRGIDAVLEWYDAGGAAADEGVPEDLGGLESLDFSEERGGLEDFGEGRVGSLKSTDLHVEGIGRSRVREDTPARLYRARREDHSLRGREPRRVRSRGRSRPLTGTLCRLHQHALGLARALALIELTRQVRPPASSSRCAQG